MNGMTPTLKAIKNIHVEKNLKCLNSILHANTWILRFVVTEFSRHNNVDVDRFSTIIVRSNTIDTRKSYTENFFVARKN